MKLAVAHPDRVVVELSTDDLHNLIGATHTYIVKHRHVEASPFGYRLQALLDALVTAQDEAFTQDARARGLTVEGDEPCVGGAF